MSAPYVVPCKPFKSHKLISIYKACLFYAPKRKSGPSDFRSEVSRMRRSRNIKRNSRSGGNTACKHTASIKVLLSTGLSLLILPDSIRHTQIVKCKILSRSTDIDPHLLCKSNRTVTAPVICSSVFGHMSMETSTQTKKQNGCRNVCPLLL